MFSDIKGLKKTPKFVYYQEITIKKSDLFPKNKTFFVLNHGDVY